MESLMFLVNTHDRGHVVIGTTEARTPRDRATLEDWGMVPDRFRGAIGDGSDLPYPYYSTLDIFALELGIVLITSDEEAL